MRRREFITLLLDARRNGLKLIAAAILYFAGAYAEAAEIHDGDTGYIAHVSSDVG
jgi:hypothetical protein